jgi:hypothetical protein
MKPIRRNRHMAERLGKRIQTPDMGKFMVQNGVAPQW